MENSFYTWHWILPVIAVTGFVVQLVIALLALRKLGGKGPLLLLVGTLINIVCYAVDLLSDFFRTLVADIELEIILSLLVSAIGWGLVSGGVLLIVLSGPGRINPEAEVREGF